jgi:hypothetical protein
MSVLAYGKDIYPLLDHVISELEVDVRSTLGRVHVQSML